MAKGREAGKCAWCGKARSFWYALDGGGARLCARCALAIVAQGGRRGEWPR